VSTQSVHDAAIERGRQVGRWDILSDLIEAVAALGRVDHATCALLETTCAQIVELWRESATLLDELHTLATKVAELEARPVTVIVADRQTLYQRCLACNREPGEPLCDLCHLHVVAEQHPTIGLVQE